MKQILSILVLLSLGMIPVSGQEKSWHMQRAAFDGSRHSVSEFKINQADLDQPILTYREVISSGSDGHQLGNPPEILSDQVKTLIWTGERFEPLVDHLELVSPGRNFSVTSNIQYPGALVSGEVVVEVADLADPSSRQAILSIKSIEGTSTLFSHRLDGHSLFFSIMQPIGSSRRFSAYYDGTWHVGELSSAPIGWVWGWNRIGIDRDGLLLRFLSSDNSVGYQFAYSEFLNSEITYSHSLLLPTEKALLAIDENDQPNFAYVVNGRLILETLTSVHAVAGLLIPDELDSIAEILVFEVDQNGRRHITVSAQIGDEIKLAYIYGDIDQWNVSVADSIGQPEQMIAFHLDEENPHFLVQSTIEDQICIEYMQFNSQVWIVNALPDTVDRVHVGVFDSESIPHVVYIEGDWAVYATLSAFVPFISNDLQNGIGSVKLLSETLSEDDHWWWSPGFEYFSTKFFPWIYHNQLGFLYWFKGPGNGVYLYDLEQGWLWSAPEVLPYLYSFDQGEWIRAYPE